MKKIILALLTLVMLIPFSACSKKDESEDVLRVGMECAYAPFNWTQMDDSNGAVAIEGGSGYAGGYDVEIAKLVAEGLGKKLVIVKIEWDGLEPGVSSGKIDAIIAGMSPTEDRKQNIDFSDYYYTSDLVVVIRKDGAYADAQTINDFAGAKITAQLNTFHYSVIDQMAGVVKQTAMEDFPTMTVALNSGKIDGYISERPGALAALKSNPDLTYIAFGEGDGFEYTPDDVAISIGLKKGSDLTAAINDILAGISEEQRKNLMDQAGENMPLE